MDIIQYNFLFHYNVIFIYFIFLLLQGIFCLVFIIKSKNKNYKIIVILISIILILIEGYIYSLNINNRIQDFKQAVNQKSNIVLSNDIAIKILKNKNESFINCIVGESNDTRMYTIYYQVKNNNVKFYYKNDKIYKLIK